MRRAFTLALPSLRLAHNDVGQLGRPEDPGAHMVMANIVNGACGLLHSLLLSKDGTMYSFGKAAGGRLGNGNDADDCYEPHPSFRLAGPCVSLSAGSMHSALVTEEGDILAWGYDSHGQVGCLGEPQGEIPRVVPRPTLVEVDDKFSQVSCSGFHTIALSQTGRVYAWGRSDYGRCAVQNPRSRKGEKDTVPLWRPRLVEEIPDAIAKVSAGGFFTIAVRKDGKSLFTFGGNGNGELGTGERSLFESKPQRIDLANDILDEDDTIADVSTGGFHTCLLTTKGKLVVFGDNHSQQLGLKENSVSSSAKPVVMDAISDIISAVSCGPTYTAVVTNNTKLWLIGGAPSASRPQLVFETIKHDETIKLPEKQGAHHVMFYLEGGYP